MGFICNVLSDTSFWGNIVGSFIGVMGAVYVLKKQSHSEKKLNMEILIRPQKQKEFNITLENVKLAKNYAMRILKISNEGRIKDEDKDILEEKLLKEFFLELKKILMNLKDITILDSKEKEIYSSLEIKEYENQLEEYITNLYFNYILNEKRTYDEVYNYRLAINIMELIYSLEMIDFSISYLKKYNDKSMTEFPLDDSEILKIKEDYLNKKDKEIEIRRKNILSNKKLITIARNQEP